LSSAAGKQSDERLVARLRGGVKRDKMKVQWTFIPLNGFTRDGEPRAFKRTGMG
jgi:hypothetical protein